MKFENIRLVGFKSFVEPVDFEIHSGLTGIIGPNGCGKSNLLEALRWVMGATSAKALRGDGMEDVIFAGTSVRPQRNWAEVTLSIANDTRNLPPEYNEHAVLEISRRITRKSDGTVSVYRINGKEVRARDIQLLFADASTGANSPALVRQGQISELINAKPQNRRRLLEEAAGITGLHTRRHESELRLKAAQVNLARLEDVTRELEVQRTGLARQARQAKRYKALSDKIRKAEAMVAYVRWYDARKIMCTREQELTEVRQLVEGTTRRAASAVAAREQTHAKLDPLRLQEAQAAAAQHRLEVAQDTLGQELVRAVDEEKRLKTEGQRITKDLEREVALLDDAASALEALRLEAENLSAREQADGDRHDMAQTALAQTKAQMAESEHHYDQQNAKLATLQAERRVLEKASTESQARGARLQVEMARLAQECDQLAPSEAQAGAIKDAQNITQTAKNTVDDAEAFLQRVEERYAIAEEQEARTRQSKQEAHQTFAGLKTEAETIERVLYRPADGDWTAIVEEIIVVPGYETALAAALGDDLEAAQEQEAPTHWGVLGDESVAAHLPADVPCLAEFVRAPAALTRRLTQIGVVDAAMGAVCQHQLAPGQKLVSSAGDVWRWDGFVARAEAKTPAAHRLEQRNRLAELQEQMQHADAAWRATKDTHQQALQEKHAAQAAIQKAKTALQRAYAAQKTTDQRLMELERQHARAQARQAAIAETLTRLQEEATQIETQAEMLVASQRDLPDLSALTATLEAAKAQLVHHRAAASEARATHAELAREAQSRAHRLVEVTREQEIWSQRHSHAQERQQELTDQLDANGLAQAGAGQAPGTIADKQRKLMDQLAIAESRRRVAADALAEAQKDTIDKDKAAKEAEHEAVDAREACARLEAQYEAAQARVAETVTLAHETCHARVEELLEIAGEDAHCDLPERGLLEEQLVKHTSERDKMGSVNLRASEEIEELDARLTQINTEQADCDSAIRKLRGAIGGLNKEGRQRLLAAFDTVNKNFQKLFVQLFGGGTAQLRLVDSDDPLDAGLEIYASPPGKKLASMSLMSGGEQALTATALIFAVFLTKPAPVCVLDEVDAPLDDTNTERFCAMLAQMAKDTHTSFIIITHHALTMSRMDRLYGVTMIENGVSQLVSVNLTQAVDLVAAE